MKHTLKIITISAGVLFAPLAAKAETIKGGPALGCRTIVQLETILEANKYDAARAGQLMDQAMAVKDCKIFKEGQEVLVIPGTKSPIYKRIRGPISVRGFWVFKGRVD